MSGHGVLLLELTSGLSFPATEYLSRIIHTQALQGKALRLYFRQICVAVGSLHRCAITLPPAASPPRSVVLDCHHVSTIDYSVISELRDLLRQFKLREAELLFCRLQVRPSNIPVFHCVLAMLT